MFAFRVGLAGIKGIEENQIEADGLERGGMRIIQNLANDEEPAARRERRPHVLEDPLRLVGFVFVAGLLAAHGEGDLGGIAPEARVPAGHLWKGQRIQLELAYLLRQKLGPALAAAGSSLARVFKADVAITDLREVPAFNQVWAKAFAGKVPATTFVPTVQPGLASPMRASISPWSRWATT